MQIQTMIRCFVLLMALALYSKAETLSNEEYDRKLSSLNGVCGRSSKTRVKRVVGGENAELGEYPWMAAVGGRRKTGDSINWACGGSLISNQYVVTAAVCLSIEPPYTYTVRLGDLNLDDSVVDGASPLDLKVESTIIHEQYNSSLRINDIGLIKLEKKVEFNDLIKPICLPPPEFSNNSYEGSQVELAGWGRPTVKSNGPRTTHLQKVVLDISSLDKCKQAYSSREGRRFVIDGNNICTQTPGKDSCQGDSGAPLMLSQDSRMYLLGMSSFGKGCANPDYPGVNVRVSQYTSWILDHMDI